MKDKLLATMRIVEELTSSLREYSDSIRSELKKLSYEDEEFKTLKKLLESSEWPQAVSELQLADENSESDKDERAENIIDIVLPSLKGKKFLDFGCGEGHVANEAAKSSAFSVGYDIVKNPRSRFEWENEGEKILLTTDLEKVKSRGPFDVILLYDVMDHVQYSTPEEILKIVHSILADDGRVYMRVHPWTSRHGGHTYRKMNKAFVHLIFTEEELASLGVELEYNLRIKTPIAAYRSWLKDSGLKNSIEPELDQQAVEPFFGANSTIRKRILRSIGDGEWRDDCPVWQMSQCFWDYVLERE